ncbi:hypothetical protein AB0M47_09130 [Hamadaea sp. NPDC051192]|uniref:hypothetical protein n=1 Tax=Hamadaea sp. NPDC051192 TaxID=3154940 RepID=UPI00342E71AB
MANPRMILCKLFETGDSAFGNSLTAGRYLAAAFRGQGPLPRPLRNEDHIIRQGYGVGFGPGGQWYFFEDIAPALTFGRAARMSLDCSGYGVFNAAHEVMFCDDHNTDERVLHLIGGDIDRGEDELEHLKRFVQGVKEHAWSSNWHRPTGFVYRLNDGRPTRTKQRSLPL